MCRPSAYTISTTESRAIHGALIHHQLTRIGRVWEASIVERSRHDLVILFVCCFFTSVRMWVFGDRQIRVVQGGLPGMTTYLSSFASGRVYRLRNRAVLVDDSRTARHDRFVFL